jgi:hypothetical protein
MRAAERDAHRCLHASVHHAARVHAFEERLGPALWTTRCDEATARDPGTAGGLVGCEGWPVGQGPIGWPVGY